MLVLCCYDAKLYHMTPTTRKEAAQIGSLHYNTGRPCLKGHAADRYTSTGNCTECLREQRSDYSAAIRAARQPTDRLVRLFTYRLHPDDHAAALAYCQSLDVQRGRMPSPAQAAVLPEPPRAATLEEVAAHRARILADLGATTPTAPRVGGAYLHPDMRRQLEAAGVLR